MSTYLYGLLGGLMIGAAAALLYWMNGRIAGVSGILVRAFGTRGAEAAWRWTWLVGLAVGGVAGLAAGADFAPRDGYPVPLLLAAGLLVGFGTRIGGGCTSGHGVCGVARLSRRSIVATVVFITVGAATTFMVRHVWGIH